MTLEERVEILENGFVELKSAIQARTAVVTNVDVESINPLMHCHSDSYEDKLHNKLERIISSLPSQQS